MVKGEVSSGEIYGGGGWGWPVELQAYQFRKTKLALYLKHRNSTSK